MSSCAQVMVASQWEDRVGAEMGTLGAAPWGWMLWRSTGASWREKGLLPVTLPHRDESQVVLARRPRAVAYPPALHSDSDPARLGEAAHSPTAALAGAGTRVPVGCHGSKASMGILLAGCCTHGTPRCTDPCSTPTLSAMPGGPIHPVLRMQVGEGLCHVPCEPALPLPPARSWGLSSWLGHPPSHISWRL